MPIKDAQASCPQDFKIFNGDYKSSIKRKIIKALYIIKLKLTLNVKEKSFGLELCNWFRIWCDFTVKQLKKFDFTWFFLLFNYAILSIFYSIVFKYQEF